MELSKETMRRMNRIEDYYYEHYIIRYRFFRNKKNEVQFNLIGEEEPIEVCKTEEDLKAYLTKLEEILNLN